MVERITLSRTTARKEAENVHASERGRGHRLFLAVLVYPVMVSKLAVQATPAHVRLLKELMTAPITMPIRNARQ